MPTNTPTSTPTNTPTATATPSLLPTVTPSVTAPRFVCYLPLILRSTKGVAGYALPASSGNGAICGGIIPWSLLRELKQKLLPWP
jgi:hypothetical protein